MKKMMLGLVLLFTTAAAFAQQRGEGRQQATPEQRAEMQTKRITEQLGLNEEQQKKVLALNLERGKQLQATQQAGNENRRELMAKYNEDLNALLTPEQQEKLKASRAEMRQRGPRNDQQRPARPEKSKSSKPGNR